MRRVLTAASLGLVTALCAAACSGSRASTQVPTPASASASAPVSGTVTASPSLTVSPSPVRTTGSAASSAGSAAFTVTGSLPVPPNGSQDTYAQAGGASCDSDTFAADARLGGQIASGFSLADLPASADLLRHFLAGAGTAVSYPDGSPVSQLARASTAFAAVNEQVQSAVARQLTAGATAVRLSAAQLTTVSFDSAGGDLYWGFRGTQGLTVTGAGHRADGGYAGTLTYVIRDSYGFPAGDTLGGFGAPMRYLQTACGAPQHPGGAHWFPDTITVTVPFNPAG